MNPKIYLGIDNCFASKRWVRPADWARVIRDLGLKYVEASADTECDPLYMGPEFTRDWIVDTLDACMNNSITNWTAIKSSIKTSLSSYLQKKTKRSPMILPVIMEN